jgi:hypothetical protein
MIVAIESLIPDRRAASSEKTLGSETTLYGTVALSFVIPPVPRMPRKRRVNVGECSAMLKAVEKPTLYAHRLGI